MKEKILELIYIGSRKPTNDGNSNYRALKFVDIVSEEEYIMHLRDDEKAAKLDPRVGDIWTGLDFLHIYCLNVKNPAITLRSNFMEEKGLLKRLIEVYQFVSKEEDKTFVFRNHNSLLVLNRNGVSRSFRVVLLKDYNTTGLEIESFSTVLQNEIANKFYINLKKWQ